MASNILKESDGKHEDQLIIVEDETKLSQVESDDGDDGDDNDDERIVSSNEDSGSDADRDSVRERRRLEKLERKERREKAITRDKIEMDFLRKRNEELERRMSAQEYRALQSDLNSYDAHIQQAVADINLSEQIIARAVEAGNGTDVVEAQRYRDQSIAKLNQLNAAKAQVAYQPQIQQQQQPQVDDLTLINAKQFMAENPWYDPSGSDEASAIVLAIDNAVHKEGFKPQTPEYWEELRKRASARLPDKFGNGRVARGGPSMGSSKEHAPTSTRKEIYISPERKQALVDAGVWDDPVLRNKYVKRYAEYDRNNKA